MWFPISILNAGIREAITFHKINSFAVLLDTLLPHMGCSQNDPNDPLSSLPYALVSPPISESFVRVPALTLLQIPRPNTYTSRIQLPENALFRFLANAIAFFLFENNQKGKKMSTYFVDTAYFNLIFRT